MEAFSDGKEPLFSGVTQAQVTGHLPPLLILEEATLSCENKCSGRYLEMSWE